MNVDTSTASHPVSPDIFKLRHEIIGNIRGQFFVPDYQRGYRWDSSDVSRLLDDLFESDGRDYSLQPVVVKLRSEGENEHLHEWELIDGQQRLTSLFLLFEYMRRNGLAGRGAPYKLKYETRPKSAEYLEKPDPRLRLENIDFYHFHQADSAIHRWFGKQGDEFKQSYIAGNLNKFLYESVRVIWYQVPTTMQNIRAIFTRLNVGRIPLTDAELIKAALLSSVDIHKKASDRAREIAAQWDGIERYLQQKDIWAFVSGGPRNEIEEKYPTRISLLLDIVADQIVKPPEGKRPRYHTFDTLRKGIEQDPKGFWDKVVALHAQILGWFEHPVIYNKIGFLVVGKTRFGIGEIVQEARGKRKSQFESYLDRCIRESINLTQDGLEELSYETSQGRVALQQILLLMNVIAVSKAQQRFPFYRHSGLLWSLEHIHAQNAESLNTREQWKTWLDEHKKVLSVVECDDNASDVNQVRGDLDAALATLSGSTSKGYVKADFDTLSGRVLRLLSKSDEPDHGIQNMALLSKEDNSRLNNAAFEVKRRIILELDREAKYVPLCTRNVFMKYYADADAQQPHFWGDKDKASYFQAICDLLQAYFETASI